MQQTPQQEVLVGKEGRGDRHGSVTPVSGWIITLPPITHTETGLATEFHVFPSAFTEKTHKQHHPKGSTIFFSSTIPVIKYRLWGN